MKEHKAIPTEGPGACFCKVCGEPVRTAFGGQFAVHADPRQSIESEWVRRARERSLPTKVLA